MWAAPVWNKHHPFLSPPFSPAALKTQFHNCSHFWITTYATVVRNPAVLLTPGLWSALSCRPKRLPPWLPCRGEAVAEDSRLGDCVIMGEFGVEVSAPVRRCSSLCLCCCSIWHTTTCCSWWGTGEKTMGSGHLWPPARTCGRLNAQHAVTWRHTSSYFCTANV